MANVLGELFGNIADAIREKTGDISTMKPIDFPDNIRAIEGSSEDVRYVTFMSEDGSVEYGKKAVAVGDDCADPLKRGVFDTPTKESTAQYSYAHYGWATEPNGATNANALKAVNDDRTVYATFAATVRYYTARFFDGDTAMGEPQQVAYGSKATPPDTTKDGFKFDNWVPADLTVYGDTDFVGVWSELTGLYYIVSVDPEAYSNIRDAAINNAGTVLSFAPNNLEVTYPAVYNISGTEATPSTSQSGSTKGYLNYAYFTYNDSYIIAAGSIGSSTGAMLYNSPSGSYYKSLISSMGSGQMAVSPTTNRIAFRSGSYNDYSIKFTTTTDAVTILAETTTPKTAVNPLAFSNDGALIVAGMNYGDDVGTYIYNSSTGALVKKIAAAASKASFNSDGTRVLVCTSSAPYVAIYDVATGNEVCNLSEWLTSTSYATYLTGTDTVVVGSGTTVRAFDISGNTPQEIEGTPVYSGGSIADVRSNHNGTRVLIRSSSAVEVWGMK